MNQRFLILTLCGLALLSTVGASLPYPMLAPLFADGSVHGLNSFLGLPPKLLLGLALMINPLGLLIGREARQGREGGVPEKQGITSTHGATRLLTKRTSA